jgi:hypothetical protein
MSGAVAESELQAADIDMDRVVADPDYRRSVITRLKRERLLKAQAPADDGEAAADED